jgi:LAO/AO transport system kinase
MTTAPAAAVVSGNRLALARLLTEVEDNTAGGREALRELFPRTGRAHLIGITGAPGTGKSSLVNSLARNYRLGNRKRVAIVAVDPSSPFSGGALLGDRVRMRDLSGDDGIFIRSMASRGSLGGLARSTAAMTHVFDAAGYDPIIIETVGAGQGEVEVARLAHTTVVVEAPGLGDEIQAIKAGILEAADILVVNKADRPGVENAERALKSMLELGHPSRQSIRHHGESMQMGHEAMDPDVWIPPILRTVATEGTGVPELAAEIERHAEHLRRTGAWAERERQRLQAELESLVQQSLVRDFRERVKEEQYTKILGDVFRRVLSPWDAATLLVDGKRR